MHKGFSRGTHEVPLLPGSSHLRRPWLFKRAAIWLIGMLRLTSGWDRPCMPPLGPIMPLWAAETEGDLRVGLTVWNGVIGNEFIAAISYRYVRLVHEPCLGSVRSAAPSFKLDGTLAGDAGGPGQLKCWQLLSRGWRVSFRAALWH